MRVDVAKLDEVLPYFEGARHLAEALGVDRKKPYLWAKRNRVPREHRLKLEQMIENDNIPPRKARGWIRRNEPKTSTPLLDGVLGG